MEHRQSNSEVENGERMTVTLPVLKIPKLPSVPMIPICDGEITDDRTELKAALTMSELSSFLYVKVGEKCYQINPVELTVALK